MAPPPLSRVCSAEAFCGVILQPAIHGKYPLLTVRGIRLRDGIWLEAGADMILPRLLPDSLPDASLRHGSPRLFIVAFKLMFHDFSSIGCPMDIKRPGQGARDVTTCYFPHCSPRVIYSLSYRTAAAAVGAARH